MTLLMETDKGYCSLCEGSVKGNGEHIVMQVHDKDPDNGRTDYTFCQNCWRRVKFIAKQRSTKKTEFNVARPLS